MGRSFSFWDLVPIVGSFRSIGHAAEDFSDGKPGLGLTNLTFGIAGFALDFCTLGTVSMMSGAIKQGAKQTSIVVATKVLEKGAQELAKESIVYTTKAVASTVIDKIHPDNQPKYEGRNSNSSYRSSRDQNNNSNNNNNNNNNSRNENNTSKITNIMP